MRTILSLTSEDVEAAVIAAKREARRLGKPVSLALTDAGGHLLHFERIDDAPPFTVRIAMEKAECVALSRRATAGWEDAVQQRPILKMLPGVMPVRGGVPILVDSVCLGGIGVAGASSEEDAAVAEAALAVIMAAARVGADQPRGKENDQRCFQYAF